MCSKIKPKTFNTTLQPFCRQSVVIALVSGADTYSNSDSASLHPDVQMGSGEFNAAVD